jgi:hypothetical protein
LLDTQYRICGKCVQALIPITSAGYAITGVLSVHTAKFSPAALQMWRREPDSHHASYIVEKKGQWLHCEHGKVLDLKTEGIAWEDRRGFPVAGIDALTVFPDRVEAAYDGKSVDLQQQVCL